MTQYLDSLAAEGDFAQFFAPDVTMTIVETGDTITGRDAVRDAGRSRRCAGTCR
ncbi:hypothetical protein [Cellulomonas fimi]|uniref:SnoaL-like domain-containing protein n=1 Tax=Cellulomonas fimi TaxID=1708 RepID=A0A7Y0QF48_CELFI|nr:hypothetical protein [Cellulomonas fimi]NMR18691.1 hypothetical protein [Cellulomonas fimi]